jgi:hypothetical protein
VLLARIVDDLAEDWRQFDDRIERVIDENRDTASKRRSQFSSWYTAQLPVYHNYQYTNLMISKIVRFLDRFELLCVRHASG